MNQQPKPASKSSKRRANLRKKQTDLIQNIAGDLRGQSAANLVAAFKNDQNAMHADVLKKIADLNSKLGQLTPGAITSAAYRKVGVKTEKDFKRKLAEMGVETDIPPFVLKELVALDDWGTVAKFAIPLIQQYGPKVLSSLYKRLLKPKLDKWMGGDEGINPADWGHVLGPSRFTGVLGENVEVPGVKSVFSQAASYNTVDPKSIGSTLAPEFYKHRYAYSETMKTALALVNGEYSITTSSTGQVGVIIAPFMAAASGVTVGASFVTVWNDVTFSVTTGAQTPATTVLNAGPLYGSVASIGNMRVTNVAIQVIPTASFNTAGAFTLGYQNRNTNGPSTTSMSVTLAQLKTYPYVTSFNNKTAVRMINVTGDSADEDLNTPAGYPSWNQEFVLLGSGLPASTEVARIVVTGIVEFIPTNLALPICVMDFPRPGPLTAQFESMMFARFPVLQQLDLVDAKRIADGLPDLPTPFDELFSQLSELITGIKPREYVSHVQGSEPLSIGDKSLDFMIE